MREYRVRKKNESLHSAKKRRLDDISAHEEQSADPIPSTRATTSTESMESNERSHHRRATAARYSRDYRTRCREARAATATATVQYDPVLQHAEAHRQFKEKFFTVIV